MTSKISICGAANLLSAIFSVDRDEVYTKLNIPIPGKHPCPVCGKSTSRYFTFCSKDCFHRYHNPLLSCSECGTLFERRLSIIMTHSKRQDYKGVGVFCSKQCQGKWWGKNHGFAAHPENSWATQGRRKWDFRIIQHLKLDTGWGAIRIGRALDIPAPTVEIYLIRGS